MPTFGHKLRHERERRNTPIQDVSARTRIELRYLEALESNDFDALPGPRGFAKLYIRAYADMLGFDPESLIEAFEKERRKQAKNGSEKPPPAPKRVRRIHYVPPLRRRVETNPIPKSAEPPVATEPIAAPEPTATVDPVATEPSRRRWILALPLIAAGLLVVAVVAQRSKSPSPLPDEGTSKPVVTITETETPAVAPAPQVVEPATPTAPAPGSIRVTESGVGSDVVDHRLVGEGTRFEEGSTVFFFTRVVGGAGQEIRHVWLYDGRVIQNMPLPVSSAHWRTYSTKTMRRQGNWAVEARSSDNRVLARAEFRCGPSSD